MYVKLQSNKRVQTGQQLPAKQIDLRKVSSGKKASGSWDLRSIFCFTENLLPTSRTSFAFYCSLVNILTNPRKNMIWVHTYTLTVRMPMNFLRVAKFYWAIYIFITVKSRPRFWSPGHYLEWVFKNCIIGTQRVNIFLNFWLIWQNNNINNILHKLFWVK